MESSVVAEGHELDLHAIRLLKALSLPKTSSGKVRRHACREGFLADTLDPHGIVVDIARAHDVLKEALVPLNYHNLDELPQFRGINTTTEFLTRHLFDHLAEAARAGKLGRDGRELKSIRVTVAESPLARAWYEAPLW